MPFVSLGLSPALCLPLVKLGYTTPTPVQTQSIPVVLSGRDLLARAQTGTGKTAAFGLQKQALQRGTDLIVATPGRLLDHMEQRTVDLSGVQILTLDEADRMVDMGFLPPLRRILSVLPRDRQTLLFSATISDEVRRLSADFTRNPARVDVSAGQVMA